MDIAEVIACNCSRCRRVGSLLAFAPATQFKLLSGEPELSSYQFNRHMIHHMFCSTCGIQSERTRKRVRRWQPSTSAA
jgi:hypothetical protein